MRMAARSRSCQQTAANSLSAGLTFRFKTRSSLAAAIILAVSLTACSLAEFDVTSHRAEDLSDAIADLRPATTPLYAVLNLDPDRLWTGMVRVAPEETSLPDTLVAENVVSLSFAGSPDDDTLAATVEAATGIPVRFGHRQHKLLVAHDLGEAQRLR